MAVHPSQVSAPAATGGNALLAREIRAALRNVRAFALLAIYVAALGAIVVSQFPSEANVDLQGGGQKGRDLFVVFLSAQAFLVVAMLPSLSVGALAQERERQTLQPLLLTPLTPLQIVWGKAGGALALAFILLLATLPLTSLCFLLGGISPGELLGAYAALLGLALFCIGVGIYCAAHWKNTTRRRSSPTSSCRLPWA
jgi:ABC-type transport system involved in multi-copper enzyme maturation permease subunit